jgi:UDP-glucose 4-epimerase
MARVVLVTGVGRYLGARVAARLSDDRSITRIIGVDTIPPRDEAALGRTEFVRADIAHPLIGTLLVQAGVDTVVHTDPGAGSTGLLAACEQARALTRLVATTSTEVYGASRHDPALFTEASGPSGGLPTATGRAAAHTETVVRAFARRRPDVTATTLRLAAAIVGPSADSWFTRYLARPIAPTVLGFDPRLQLLHEYDAVQATVRAARMRIAGPVNVAGAGIVPLTRALRLAGRLRVPVHPGLVGELAPLLRFSPVADTTRMFTEFGYHPRYTTLEALYAHLRAHPGRIGPGPLAAAALAGVQRLSGEGS